MNIIAIDFETFYSSKLGYSLTTMHPEEYCKHDLFDPYLLSVYDGTESWVGNPRDYDWKKLDGQLVLAHNAMFETTVCKEMIKRGWIPQFEPAQFLCTADMSAYLCGRRSLAQAVEHLLGERVSKAARSDANNKHWADFSLEDRNAMLEYAKFDTIHCWNLFAKHGSRWPEIERKLSVMTREQGQRGVMLNVDLLNEYIFFAHDMLMATEEQIPWIAGLSATPEEEEVTGKPTSTKAIAAMCRKEGIPCQPVKSHDEEAYAAWMDEFAPKYPWIRAVNSWRSVNKMYKMLLLLKRRVRPDGTMPFSLKYFGAHTGRWSGDANFNMQNQRKKPILADRDMLMIDDEDRIDAAMDHFKEHGAWPEYVAGAMDFRKLIIPRPGKKMIVSDLEQIEPRVLNKLAGNQPLLDKLASGMSVYEAHARDTMGWTGGKLKKENPGLYALAKARVLGLGYGCGWKKFIVVARAMAQIDITKDDPEFVYNVHPETGETIAEPGYGKFSREIVKAFRDSNPLIAHRETGLWARLELGLRRSIAEDYTVGLPNGRELTYEKVRMAIKLEPNPDDPERPIRRHRLVAGIGGRWRDTYGGLLTENLVQAVARDIFAEHLIKLHEAGLTILFHVHDEAVLEVDETVTTEEVARIMSYCPAWFAGCPISAEAKEVPHYIK